jgi:uncharacterized protein YndB with AHSA1/START domain/DNA-binding transcriptional ArsR family regulator
VQEDRPENNIFKALADPSRRLLLDLLYEADGRTLTELCDYLNMTRHGVMKHLSILEEAGVITTRKSGREKLHFLNPVPITQIHDRWVSKFAKRWTVGLNQLKYELESEHKMNKHVFQIWIRTTPERLWQALTDPEVTYQFLYQSRVVCDWKVGSDISFVDNEGTITATGQIAAFDPPVKLSYTWKFLSVATTSADEPSRITYEIMEQPENPGVCTLIVTHDQLEQAPNTFRFVGNGWPGVLSNLKTLLETGTPLIQIGR